MTNETRSAAHFPQELHGYVLGRQLGSSAAAKLFAAKVRESGAPVALKTWAKSYLTSEARCERINSEVDIHSTLCHEHISKFYTAFEDDDAVYLVTELAQTSLLSYIQLNRLSEGRIRKFFTQILKAVDYVHSKHLVHRDLKLSNILMSGDDVKVADFGHARLVESGLGPDTTLFDGANYMSPEVVAHHACGQAADMWALGCLLLCLFTGKPPFKSSQNNYNNLAMGYELPSSLSLEVRDLVARLLENDQRKRATAREALQHSWISQRAVRRTVLHQSNVAPKTVPTLSAISANIQRSRLATSPLAATKDRKLPPTSSRWYNNSLHQAPAASHDNARKSKSAPAELSPKLKDILQNQKVVSPSLLSKNQALPSSHSPSSRIPFVTSRLNGQRLISNSSSDFAEKYRFSTKNLRFIQQETKHGSAGISEDGLRLRFSGDQNTFHISSDGETIEVSDGHASQIFSLDDLPVRFLNAYRYGSRFVSLIRSKTCNAAIESGDIRARLFLDDHFDMLHNKDRVVIRNEMIQVWVDGQMQWKGTHPPDPYRHIVSTAKQWNGKLCHVYQSCQTVFVPGYGWMDCWGRWKRFLFLDGVQLDVYNDTLARDPKDSELRDVQVRLGDIKRGFGVDVRVSSPQ